MNRGTNINFVRVNNQIRAEEVRVVGPDGASLGVMKFAEALQKARDAGLDLIEISSKTTPIIVKITDYGRFQYEQKKKLKQTRTRATETKSVQIKISTSEHDLELKAKKISGWLKEKHRVKLDLFLVGRAKYMDKQFLNARLARIFKLITEKHKIADGPKQSPKGLSVIIEHEK